MAGHHSFLLSIKDITVIALLTAILFVQEELLTFIPNVQLTVFLLVLYSKKLGFFRTSIIVVIHVILDNLIIGSFSLIYTPAMFIGWELIPVIICTVFKKTESNVVLAFAGILSSLLYSWVFILPACILYKMSFVAYMIGDVLFEIILALSSFVSILLLYKPLSKVFDKFEITKVNNKKEENQN